ncbi:MAG: hypothetical protein L3J59_06860, partial [Methylococcaceae bacterium]|nr:hypothetical protein [Methylococcaceae bacterium]
HYAKVIGGYLIENFPGVKIAKNHHLTKEQSAKLEQAYKADIIHLLVGPLAEAKYVSIRDGEAFNFNLLITYALSYYGGLSDVEKAYSYMAYFVASKAQGEALMLKLFSEAFKFIENTHNWKCILNLAHYILKSKNQIVSCEKAIKILDNC